MAYSTDDSIKNAATKAANRWKNDGQKTPALKDQIVDTFRLSKLLSSENVRLPQIREMWKQAFKKAGSAGEIDFDDEQQI